VEVGFGSLSAGTETKKCQSWPDNLQGREYGVRQLRIAPCMQRVDPVMGLSVYESLFGIPVVEDQLSGVPETVDEHLYVED